MQRKSLDKSRAERQRDRTRVEVARLLPRQRTQEDWLAAELAAEVSCWEEGQRIHRRMVAGLMEMASAATEGLPVVAMRRALSAVAASQAAAEAE